MNAGQLLVQIVTDMSSYDKSMDQAEKRAGIFGKRVGGVINTAFSFAAGMAFFEAIQQGFRATIGVALGFNSMLQQAEIGFETMLGSAEKAQKFLDDMADFAARTPFEYPDLLRSARFMMALGFSAEEVLPTLKSVGDAVAGLGLGGEDVNRVVRALGEMRMAGRVNSRDMFQLTNAGIPAWEMLGEAIGKSVAETRKLSEEGKLDSAWGVEVLVQGMAKRFPNMMQKMEDSWAGNVSTMKDVWRLTVGAMTRDFFRNTNLWLTGIKRWAQQFYDIVRSQGIKEAIGQMIGPDVLDMIENFAAVGKMVFGGLSRIIGFFRDNLEGIRPVALKALQALLMFKVAATVFSISTAWVQGFRLAILGLSNELVGKSVVLTLVSRTMAYYNAQLWLAAKSGIAVTGVFTKMKIAAHAMWVAIGGPVALVIAKIAAVIAAGVYMYRNWEKVKHYGIQAWSVLKQGIALQAFGIVSIMKLILGWIPGIGGAFGKLQKTLAGYISKERALMTRRQNLYKAAGNLGLGDLKTAEQKLAKDSENTNDSLNDQEEALKNLGKAANLQSFDEVHQLSEDKGAGDLSKLFEFPEPEIPGIDTGEMDEIMKSLEESLTKSEGLWTRFKGFMGTTWGAIKNQAGSAWTSIKDTIGSKWDDLMTNSPIVWGNIKTNIGASWDSLKTGASTAWENIRATVATKWDNLKTNAPIVWDNIKSSISTRWDNLKTNAPVIWSNIKTSISSRWGQLKSGAVTDWEAIRSTVATSWDNLKTNAPTVWDNIKDSISNRFAEAKSNVSSSAGTMKKNISDSWDGIIKRLTEIRNTLHDKLTEPFESAKTKIDEIIKNAKTWGGNFIDNIVDGIKSSINRVKEAGGAIAGALMDFLGFQSPTKEGPGRTADTWAPNLMEMYAQGIVQNAGLVKSAASMVARQLSAMASTSIALNTAAPAVAMPGAGLGGGMNSRGTESSTTPFILQVGVLVADDMGLKKLEQKLRQFRIEEDRRINGE